MKFSTALAAGLLAWSSIAQAQTFKSSAGDLKVDTVVGGLAHPWSLAFLPDGNMLVTERPGRLRIATRDGKLSAPLAGLPRIYASGQGGLLDVVPDRDFARNRTIYFCFAELMDGGARSALARARLADAATPRLDDVQVIYRQEGPPSSGQHFGCRVAQSADNLLFLTQGDHGSHRNEAQNLGNHLGKIVRLKDDGSVHPDNVFLNQPNARPEIYTRGHRNQQGLTFDAGLDSLIETEHGPKGGDELNIILPGRNYGWPVITYGMDYSGAYVSPYTERPGMSQPILQWTPSIAPSGLTVYRGDKFPSWVGDVFVGSLAFKHLRRVDLDLEGNVIGQEELLTDLGARIRDVRTGPDGYLYVTTDYGGNDRPSGRVLRLEPAP